MLLIWCYYKWLKSLILTNTEVKQVKPKDKEYNLNDGDGLMLRVKPNGSKSWLFNYYHPITKKRKNLSLGQYPALSIADARKNRTAAKELLAQEVDPKEHRDELYNQKVIANSQTLEHLASEWFAIKKSKIAETTAISLWRNFENHIFAKLGHRPIDKLLAPEVINILKPLAAKGSLETTSKIIGHLNEVMTYAVNTGVIQYNPLAGIRAAFETPKATHLATLTPQELPELMKELSFASIKLTTRCLIEFQLHTMVRPAEAAEARWEDIDIENSLWSIPAAKMKMKRGHLVPLKPQVLNILNRVRQVSVNSEFVFPSDRNIHKPSSSATANNALKKRMPFKNRLVSHGMRALASTTLNEERWDPQLIEVALAHVDKNTVRDSYNHASYLEPRRKMMTWWSNHIEKCSFGDLSMLNHINK